jgi:hypothetical protein
MGGPGHGGPPYITPILRAGWCLPHDSVPVLQRTAGTSDWGVSLETPRRDQQHWYVFSDRIIELFTGARCWAFGSGRGAPCDLNVGFPSRLAPGTK